MTASKKEDFKNWIKTEKKEIFRKLSEVTSKFDKELTAGQICTFINEDGVKLPGYTIMGFCKPTNGTTCVYLDKYNYYLPVQPDSIIIENDNELVTLENALGLCEIEYYEECEYFFSRDLKLCQRSTSNHYWCDIMVNMPTRSRAIQWLKDNKNIEIDIIWNYFNGSDLNYSVFVYAMPEKECIYSSDAENMSFPTYTIALEAGIGETISLLY